MGSNIKLTLAYDGTDFHGFQSQRGAGRPLRTVQGVLEDVLTHIVGTPVAVTGAGRTDAGVHARGQVVTFATDGAIPVERWTRLLNDRFPRDMVALSAQNVPPTFHPRYDAKRKIYRYTVETAPLPNIFTRRFSAHLGRALDTESMRRAASYFIGTHDFTSFSAARAAVTSRVRTLYDVRLSREGSLVHIWYEGNSFLQYMVRIITGTLVDVGLGRRAACDVPEILAAKDRTCAGPTMPPQGLTLWEVTYGI